MELPYRQAGTTGLAGTEGVLPYRKAGATSLAGTENGITILYRQVGTTGLAGTEGGTTKQTGWDYWSGRYRGWYYHTDRLGLLVWQVQRVVQYYHTDRLGLLVWQVQRVVLPYRQAGTTGLAGTEGGPTIQTGWDYWSGRYRGWYYHTDRL